MKPENVNLETCLPLQGNPLILLTGSEARQLHPAGITAGRSPALRTKIYFIKSELRDLDFGAVVSIVIRIIIFLFIIVIRYAVIIPVHTDRAVHRPCPGEIHILKHVVVEYTPGNIHIGIGILLAVDRGYQTWYEPAV
ncbi:hypothetical protein ES703_82103 [subsurface metagenome]